ncbi:MAG: methyltransferase domain-containing protein [Solirubrobacterales bacterium]
MSRKHDIAAAFSAAAGTYEGAAEAQALAADLVAEAVAAGPLPPAPRVLEIGCGTGLLTRRLLPRFEGRWLVTDLAPAMVEAARRNVADPRAEFRVMDGEHPEGGPFDLIVSNLAAQWFADLPAAVRRLAGLLAPGGRLVLSTLGAASFREWRQAHAALDLSCGTPAYPGADTLRAALPDQARVLARSLPVRYADGRAFLKALKAIGAGTPACHHRPLPPGALRKVLAALGAPATITYEVLIVDLARGKA